MPQPRRTAAEVAAKELVLGAPTQVVAGHKDGADEAEEDDGDEGDAEELSDIDRDNLRVAELTKLKLNEVRVKKRGRPTPFVGNPAETWKYWKAKWGQDPKTTLHVWQREPQNDWSYLKFANYGELPDLHRWIVRECTHGVPGKVFIQLYDRSFTKHDVFDYDAPENLDAVAEWHSRRFAATNQAQASGSGGVGGSDVTAIIRALADSGVISRQAAANSLPGSQQVQTPTAVAQPAPQPAVTPEPKEIEAVVDNTLKDGFTWWVIGGKPTQVPIELLPMLQAEMIRQAQQSVVDTAPVAAAVVAAPALTFAQQLAEFKSDILRSVQDAIKPALEQRAPPPPPAQQQMYQPPPGMMVVQDPPAGCRLVPIPGYAQPAAAEPAQASQKPVNVLRQAVNTVKDGVEAITSAQDFVGGLSIFGPKAEGAAAAVVAPSVPEIPEPPIFAVNSGKLILPYRLKDSKWEEPGAGQILTANLGAFLESGGEIKNTIFGVIDKVGAMKDREMVRIEAIEEKRRVSERERQKFERDKMQYEFAMAQHVERARTVEQPRPGLSSAEPSVAPPPPPEPPPPPPEPPPSDFDGGLSM